MGKAFLKNTADLLQKKHKRKQWQKIMISLSLVVALLTSCLLIHPAITMSRQATCGQEEHTHTEKCYEKKLICNKEEQSISESSETEGEESVEAHTHSDACYENVLICGKQEHTHSEACYPKEEEKKEEVAANTEEEKSEDKDVKSEDQEDKAEEKTEDTEKAEARTLKVDQADYTVEVDCPSEANIPKDAKLKVREIKKDSDEYQDYYEKAMKAVASGDETDISFARFFDISFEVDGKEIEPEAKVEVKITYDDKVEVPEKGKVKSVHFGNKTEVLDVKTNEKNGKMDEVKFDADSFSVYAIVGTETSIDGELTFPAEDQTFTAFITGYNISVNVPAKSFKDEVSLKAIEQSWADLASDVQNQLKEQGVSEENSQSLDLHFEDMYGKEIEPANKVSVKFTIKDENVVSAANSDESTVDVYHVEETKDEGGEVKEVEVKQVASTDDEKVVAYNEEQATAEFETDRFSTFTITWNNSNPLTVHLGYVNSNGQFVEFEDTYQVNSQNITRKTQLSDFVSSYSVDSGNNDNNTIIGIYTENPGAAQNKYDVSNYIGVSNDKWYLYSKYSSSRPIVSNLTDLYVVYDSDTSNYAAVYYIRLDGQAQPEYHNGESADGYPSSAYSKGILADSNGSKIINAANVLGENPQWIYKDGQDLTSYTLLQPTQEDMFNAIKAQGNSFTDNQGNRIDLSQYETATAFFTDYEVQWYVIKLHSSGTYYVNNDYTGKERNSSKIQYYKPTTYKYSGLWHIDGVLVKKDSVWLRYRSNIDANDSISSLSNTLIIDTSYARNTKTTVQGTWSNNTRVAAPPRRNDGFVFLHWNTERDDSGTTYNIGDDINLPNDVTLYAIWVEPTLTVTKTFSGVDALPYNFQVQIFEGTGESGTLFRTLSLADATASRDSNNNITGYTWRLTASDGVMFGRNYYAHEFNSDVEGYTLTPATTYGGGNTEYVTVQQINLNQNTVAINNVYEVAKIDITIKKTDTNGVSLSGATFRLTKGHEAATADSGIDATGNLIEGTDDAGNGNGIYSVMGLPDGTYTLTEVSAPAGYIILTEPLQFTVSKGTVTKVDGTDTSNMMTIDGTTVSVKNTAGQALPNTGGSGTMIYTLGGLLLIMGVALMYGFGLRRRRERRLN